MKKEIEKHLEEIFSRDFILNHGIKNATDANYMLVADIISDSLDKFAEVVEEEFLNCICNNATLKRESLNTLL